MADGMYNIEILMRMSRTLREQNEDWRKDVWIEGQAKYKQAVQLRLLFEQEYANLDQECRRLEVYAPKVQEPMPKVITKGTANEPVQRQEDERRNPNNQIRQGT